VAGQGRVRAYRQAVVNSQKRTHFIFHFFNELFFAINRLFDFGEGVVELYGEDLVDEF
jgi:hypothetical protein